MKIKAIVAAVAAVAAVSAVSVCGFAESAGSDTPTESQNSGLESIPESDIASGNPDTGAEGVAAVAGAIALAGAAVAISRRKE